MQSRIGSEPPTTNQHFSSLLARLRLADQSSNFFKDWKLSSLADVRRHCAPSRFKKNAEQSCAFLKKVIESESNSATGCNSDHHSTEQAASNACLLNPQLALLESIQNQLICHLQQMTMSLGSRLIELIKSANNLTYELQPSLRVSEELKAKLNSILADEANARALGELLAQTHRVEFSSSPLKSDGKDAPQDESESQIEFDAPCDSQEGPASQPEPAYVSSKRQRKEPCFLSQEKEAVKANGNSSSGSKQSSTRPYIRSGKYAKDPATKVATKAAGWLPLHCLVS